MTVYYDIFGSWEDVQREFDMKEPEPEVLFAAYEYESYSGEAFVIFKRDGKLYTVEGGHCSCYGLEEMWDPQESTPEVVRRIVEQANTEWAWNDDLKVRHKDALRDVCTRLESGA